MRLLVAALQMEFEIRLAGAAIAARAVAMTGQVVESPRPAAHGFDNVSFGNSAAQTEDHRSTSRSDPYPILKVDFKWKSTTANKRIAAPRHGCS